MKTEGPDCLRATHLEAMAFDGAWKIDRNENYDKFMEKMGKGLILSGSFFASQFSSFF